MSYRKAALNLPEDVTKAELISILGAMVEEDQVSAEAVKEKLGQLRAASHERVATTLNPEVKEIAGQMEKDYARSVDTLQFYGALKVNKEKPGEYFYPADFGDFDGDRFVMPSFQEVLARLTPEEVKLYKELLAKGLQPKLQLAPIGYKIRTLGQMINAKRKELKINKSDTFIWDEIKDEELVYDAESFKASEDGQRIIVTGGKSKSDLIKENAGWLIEINSMKQDLEPDADKIKNNSGRELTTARKTEMYMTEARSQGYKGNSYETYLAAQMEALRNGKPLEKQFWTILPESTFTNTGIVADGRWSTDRVNLRRSSTDNRYVFLRFRRSVRVQKLGL